MNIGVVYLATNTRLVIGADDLEKAFAARGPGALVLPEDYPSSSDTSSDSSLDDSLIFFASSSSLRSTFTA